MRLTKSKAEILKLFNPENVDFIRSEVGNFPLDVAAIASLVGRDSRATRRTLEAMVSDGLLVKEVRYGYHEVSTGRTMNRKGYGYDLPAEKRGERKEKPEEKSIDERVNEFLDKWK